VFCHNGEDSFPGKTQDLMAPIGATSGRARGSKSDASDAKDDPADKPEADTEQTS
jgi:hypothetical protein